MGEAKRKNAQIKAVQEDLRRLPDSFTRFVDGADLLIADGQYTETEYPKKIGWGHARANTVVVPGGREISSSQS